MLSRNLRTLLLCLLFAPLAGGAASAFTGKQPTPPGPPRCRSPEVEQQIREIERRIEHLRAEYDLFYAAWKSGLADYYVALTNIKSAPITIHLLLIEKRNLQSLPPCPGAVKPADAFGPLEPEEVPPPPVPRPDIDVPEFFCSEADKQQVVDGLKKAAAELDAYIDRVRDEPMRLLKAGLGMTIAEREAWTEASKAAERQADLVEFWLKEAQKRPVKDCAKPKQTGMGPSGAQTEFYAGVGLGGESQNSEVAWNPNFTPPDNFGVASAAQSTLNQTGVAVTGQIGADLRWGQAVFGGVFDAAYKGGDPTRLTFYANPFGGVFPIRQTFVSNFEITLRGRVGYEFALSPALSVMPYATAGLAVTQMWVSDAMYFPTSFNYGASSQFRPGWGAGGGLEFRTNWPVRVQMQYLHMDFGDIAYIAPNTTSPASFIDTHHKLSEDRATIGVVVSFDDFSRLVNRRH